ncbi:uncharacterized protein LOC111638040 [Centruroides sculpturatus]|uniref:uncharacterized protein LOC111638034 n=1 Tax=Centruroides sculpturatus TaxID=218467 RepID=UPI000C6D980D|nr:uncharacterized protein LOC111638034 [Centruroides sculpturatus]XP_023239443.1 uncharacterized protein LOC111638040 [Centruroides sculpturatus]
MMKFLLPFLILSLILNQPGNCVVNNVLSTVVESLSTDIINNLPEKLSAVLKEFGPNARFGLLNCLNSSMLPYLSCKNETNSGSDWLSIFKLIPCVLKKICYANDSASATRVIRCITAVVVITGNEAIKLVGNMTNDLIEKYVQKIYICLFGIYSYIRNGVTNCDFIDAIQELNVAAIVKNLENNLLSDTTDNLETFLKILFGITDEKCSYSR